MKITISSSHRFFDTIPTIQKLFMAIGCEVFTPHLEYTTDLKLIKQYDIEFNQYLNQTDFLYINDLGGYIGLSVAKEIGYAFAKRIKIVFREKPIDLGFIHHAKYILTPEQFVSLIQNRSMAEKFEKEKEWIYK